MAFWLISAALLTTRSGTSPTGHDRVAPLADLPIVTHIDHVEPVWQGIALGTAPRRPPAERHSRQRDARA